MPRYELPPDLSPDEERAVIAALERLLDVGRGRPSAWVSAGRTEALRLGGLQVRRQSDGAWRLRGRTSFARGAPPDLAGRGDAK
jgi:hypothetical protein